MVQNIQSAINRPVQTIFHWCPDQRNTDLMHWTLLDVMWIGIIPNSPVLFVPEQIFIVENDFSLLPTAPKPTHHYLWSFMVILQDRLNK